MKIKRRLGEIMKIVLRKESNTPLYLQIYEQIVQRIQGGILTDGDPLPSLRIMAGDLNISVLTVRKAYKWLETKGYVRIQTGKGILLEVYMIHMTGNI